ncbi:MAG: hypothetical protein ACI8QC_002073 [Planctomycetota bacterium]|jgi:hypothetical protein
MTKAQPSLEDSQDVPQPLAPSVPTWVEIAGWLGTLAILGAYLASSMDWLSNQSASYQALNLGGAVGVGLVCWYRRTWQAFALEAAWGSIALASWLGM